MGRVKNKVSRKSILIDCTSCHGRISGLERYTIEIVNRLILIDHSNYVLAIPKGTKEFNNVDRCRIHRSWFNNRLINEWLFLPWVFLKTKCSAVFFPAFPPSLVFKIFNCEIYRTVHDAVMWKYPNTISIKTKLYTKILETVFISRYNKILTVSEFSKAEIQEVFPKLKTDILNTYNGVDFDFDYFPDKIKTDLHFNSKYILTVGTIEPRKNYVFLIRVFKQVLDSNPSIKLVIAGRKGWGIDEVNKEITRLGIADSVILTGGVSDEKLYNLYYFSDLFVYPSIYEGFGLPLLEAMFFKKFIISANNSALPEVVGKAGILLKTFDTEKWVNTINEFFTNPNLYISYTENASNQLRKFNWENIAALVHRFINE